jgi:DNA-binding transcriptional LysR family regulator
VVFGSKSLLPGLASYLERHPNVNFGVDLAGTTVDIDFAGFDAAAGLRRPTIEDIIAGPLESYGLMIRGAPSYPKRSSAPVSFAETVFRRMRIK